MDANRIAEALRKLDAQDFNPGDSFLASLVNNPAGLLTKWLPRQVNTAAGIPDQYDNPTPWLAPSVEDQIGAANNVAGIAQLGAFPTAPQVGKGTLGTMGGINAANAPKEQFAQAEAIAKALRLSDLPVGSDDWMNANRDIWGQTGIHYGADNMPRFEIDDSGARLRMPEDFKQAIIEKKGEVKNITDLIKSLNETKKVQNDLFPKELNTGIKQLQSNKKSILNDIERNFGLEWGATGYNGARLKYALDHNEIPISYPDLSDDVIVRLEKARNDGLKGSYDKNKMDIYALNSKGDKWSPTSTALHETQHAIQDYEGWGQGGNPAQFQGEENPYELYQRLAGEAEARAVQKRMNYTPEQRSQVFPLDDYDRNISDLIVRRGDGSNMSVSDNLNESLLQKYLTTGQLSPEEMAQYEANAVQMRDSNRQHLNVANADAQGGTAMDRARGMGFDTDVYHGTKSKNVLTEAELKKASKAEQMNSAGFHVAESPSFASIYGEDGSVYPLLINKGSMLDASKLVNVPSTEFEISKRLQKRGEKPYTDNGLSPPLQNYLDSAAPKKAELELSPFDSVKYEAIYGEAPFGGRRIVTDKSQSYLMRNHKNIRSRFAAFDPLRKDSADLLASWLLPATMLGYGMYNQQPNNQSLAEALRGQ